MATNYIEGSVTEPEGNTTMSEPYRTVEDLEALPDGAQVVTVTAGSSQQWTKTGTGLSKDGAVVPFRLFVGALGAGEVSDGTNPVPTKGQWYRTVPPSSWLYILAVDTAHVTYMQCDSTRMLRRERSVALSTWSGYIRNGTRVVEPEPEEAVASLLTIERLADEAHMLTTQVTAQRAEVAAGQKVLAHQSQFESVAARLNDPALNRLMTRVGWGRAYEVVVSLTISGQVRIGHREMKRVTKNGPTTGVLYGEANVPFTIRAQVTQHVGEGGCACGDNTPTLRELAEPYLPDGALAQWRVRGACANH